MGTNRSAIARPSTSSGRTGSARGISPAAIAARIRRDPAVASAVLSLWLLLALFVIYPLAMLLARVLVDQGTFTTAGLAAVVTDRHQMRAFWNSLLLGSLVGIVGTFLGFLFAFTAARGRLPPQPKGEKQRRENDGEHGHEVQRNSALGTVRLNGVHGGEGNVGIRVRKANEAR